MKVKQYINFRQNLASTPFNMVIEDASIVGDFTFYREEDDGEIWNVKTFHYLSEAFLYFAQQLKECGR